MERIQAKDLDIETSKWASVSIRVLSPDDPSQPVGDIIFLVCPACGAMVPVKTQDEMDFPRWHVEWHREPD